MPEDLIGCDFCKFVNYEDSDDFFISIRAVSRMIFIIFSSHVSVAVETHSDCAKMSRSRLFLSHTLTDAARHAIIGSVQQYREECLWP